MKLLKKSPITLFDLLIICAFLVVFIGFFSLRASKKTQWVTVRLIVSNDEWWSEASPPQWWYVEGLTPGQVSKNSLGDTIAEIVNVDNFDIGQYRRRAFIDIRIKGSFDKKRGVYIYNYQPIQIGKALDFTFGKNNVHGLVTYIDSQPQPYKNRTIEVKLSAVRPWVAQSYTQGLEMKDTQGRVLAAVQSVSIAPSTVNEVTELGETQKKFSGSYYNEVVLVVKIKTYESAGIEYFVDRSAIKVGSRIWFQFPKTIIREAEIIRIIE